MGKLWKLTLFKEHKEHIYSVYYFSSEKKAEAFYKRHKCGNTIIYKIQEVEIDPYVGTDDSITGSKFYSLVWIPGDPYGGDPFVYSSEQLARTVGIARMRRKANIGLSFRVSELDVDRERMGWYDSLRMGIAPEVHTERALTEVNTR